MLGQRVARLLSRALIVFLLAAFLPASASPTVAVSPTVVISQVYGGGGNSGATLRNDFIELFNRGAAPASVDGWSVQYAATAGTSWQSTALSGTIPPGGYYLVQEAVGAGGSVSLPTPDATGGIPMSSTNGKVALVSSTTALSCGSNCDQTASVVDFVGFGTANDFEGASAASATSNTTAAIRAGGGCADTDNNGADFSIGAPTPRNSASPLQPCGVTSTSPTLVVAASPSTVERGAPTLLTTTVQPGTNPASTGLTVSANLSAIGGAAAQPLYDDGTNGDATSGDLVFSYLATVSPTSATCARSLGFAVADAEGRTGSATLSLTVVASATIEQIQGAAHISPYNLQCVAATGIVTARYGSGFYLQDPTPDADPSTSAGILVYTSSAPTVAVGDAACVAGVIKEYRPGGSGGLTNLTTTEFDRPVVTVISSGNPLPAPIVIGQGGRIPPTSIIEDDTSGSVETGGSFDPGQDGIDFYESLEGMRVQVNGALAVGPTNAFGEIPVVSDGGALSGVDTARGGLVVQATDYNPERIILDDTLVAMPNVKVGATFAGPIVGVLDYSFANYKLFATASPAVLANSLTQESVAISTDELPGGKLAVATFNVENLRPSDPAAKFAKLAELIVENLGSPDLIAVEEIQDNSGATDNAIVDASVTYQMLIAAISAAGGPTYTYRQVDPANNQDGGEPGGNIRQGFLYRTDRGLSFVDRPGATATAATAVEVVAGAPRLTLSPGRVNPTNAAFTASRKPLAGEFLYKGETLFVIANHFNSKGGDQPLFGRYQPPVLSSEVQRIQQATAVAGFVQSILAADPEASVVVLGDLNDFQFSAPLGILKDADLNALIETLPVGERYTYVYDGNSQALDHVLVSDGLLSRPYTIDVVHVNAEFPAATRASDHDPQVVQICVDQTAPTISIELSKTTLWPPDHRLIRVYARVTVADNSGSERLELVSVTSNEPDNGLGDGDTPGDIVIVNQDTFKLRAERSGTGEGRTYTITYRVTDACGNSATASATVSVPFSLGTER